MTAQPPRSSVRSDATSLRPWLIAEALVVALLLLACPAGAAPDKADEASYNFATGSYGSVVLGDAGGTFFRTFFRRGWPTTRAMRTLTLEDSGGTAKDTLQAQMFSGLGVPLFEGKYLEAVRGKGLKKGGKAWQKNSDVIDSKFIEFAAIAGLAKAPSFRPVLFEFEVGKPRYTKPYVADDPGSQIWTTTGVDRKQISMESVCMALWAQAAYARRQLLESSHKADDGKSERLGSNPEDCYYALVGLLCAIAKVHELKFSCVTEGRTLDEYPDMVRYGLRETKRWIPHRIHYEGSGNKKYKANTGKNAINSQLRDQSALLLGCAELLQVLAYSQNLKSENPNAQELGKLFSSQKYAGFSDVAIDPDAFLMVLEVANFTVANMQRLHFDPDDKMMRSRSSKNPDLEKGGQTLVAADAGLALMALQAYLKSLVVVDQAIDSMKSKDMVSVKTGMLSNKSYATTMVKLISVWLTSRADGDVGLYDRYNISTRQNLTRDQSAETLGMVVSALLDSETLPKGTLPEDKVAAARIAAEKFMKQAEIKLWNPSRRLYIGRALKKSPTEKAPLKVKLIGQLAMADALRKLADGRGDVRYLIRLGELVSSLKEKGAVLAETEAGGERGGDSDGDGVGAPSSVAPVLREELELTK